MLLKSYVSPSPSDAVWNPIARSTENTGMVFCPQRLSHIGKMRCGEYQERFGCQLRCKNAVAPAEVRVLRLLVDARVAFAAEPERGAARPYYDHCIICGEPKARTRFLRCRHCHKIPLGPVSNA